MARAHAGRGGGRIESVPTRAAGMPGHGADPFRVQDGAREAARRARSDGTPGTSRERSPPDLLSESEWTLHQLEVSAMPVNPPRAPDHQPTFTPPDKPSTSPGGAASRVPYVDSNRSTPIPPA